VGVVVTGRWCSNVSGRGREKKTPEARFPRSTHSGKFGERSAGTHKPPDRGSAPLRDQPRTRQGALIESLFVFNRAPPKVR
jgi:hypothetical protein